MPENPRNGRAAGRPGSAKPLVIVESPAKARTISAMLGPDFVVESSVGHIRDLPRRAGEVPAAYRGEGWARLGVDVDNGFKPLYVVSPEKQSVVTRLKQAVRRASEVYVATDEDREGESIAWHLIEVLSPDVPVKRMVFHEITRPAIEHAVQNWRELDRRLVDAQEARRILDRLYGYEVSPVLWKKVMPRLSAGRVQSVATRMIVDRERARMRFRPAGWWDVEGTFAPSGAGDSTTLSPSSVAPSSVAPSSGDSRTFKATLVTLDGMTLATGRDFTETGELKAPSRDTNSPDTDSPDTNNRIRQLDEGAAQDLAARLTGRPFEVKSVSERPFRRSPAAPFITSTLQQEAGRKLRFGAQRTMQVAQRLYEQGWITYMRTDSTTLSDEALSAAREQAARLYGAEYVPDRPRRYEKKVKNAQEAHEAIRPSGDTFRTPDQAAGAIAGDEMRLYDLIWKRTVASQMADARGTTAQVRIEGTAAPAPSGAAEVAEFGVSGTVITFPGFLRAYVEGSDDPDAELAERDTQLPALSEGDALSGDAMEARGHTTQPPARFTEASLVKALEDQGVGRPSTYASIIGTIQDRGYVWKKGTALVPSFTAFAVIGLLERHFGDLVDYGFTAAMEDDLDRIAEGREEVLPWLTRFYFGETDGASDGNGKRASSRGLKEEVATHLGEIDAREINSIPIGKGSDGDDIVLRVGRYGPYLQHGEERASIPEDLAPDELTVERAEELLAAPSGDRVVGQDPATGLDVIVRAGRYGPYVQLGEAKDGEKPTTSSLFSTMTPATVTLDEALRLLSLPRLVGVDPSNGEEIHALNGKFGPYLKRGTETRSLESQEQIFDVSLDQGVALFAQPKTARGRTPAVPLKELGTDPATNMPVTLRNGRFGPYVTDGTTNASLRRGDDVDSITIDRAAELLADRRAAGPPQKRGRAAKTAKKTTKAAKATKTAKTAKTAKKAAKTTKKAAKATKTAKKVTKAVKAAASGSDATPT
jgi:DNA topoisomerase-1